jgi:hypothetical protein
MNVIVPLFLLELLSIVVVSSLCVQTFIIYFRQKRCLRKLFVFFRLLFVCKSGAVAFTHTHVHIYAIATDIIII